MNQDAGVAAKASWKPNVYSCGLGGSQMRKNYINMRRTPKWAYRRVADTYQHRGQPGDNQNGAVRARNLCCGIKRNEPAGGKYWTDGRGCQQYGSRTGRSLDRILDWSTLLGTGTDSRGYERNHAARI